MAVIPGTRNFKTWQGSYDFNIDGGGTGLPQTITLRSPDGPLPIGSVILDGYIDVLVACLSATGTIAVQAEAAGDILAPAAQAALTLGRKSIIPSGVGANAVKTTAERSPAIVIATAAFTAGAFTVVLEYR